MAVDLPDGGFQFLELALIEAEAGREAVYRAERDRAHRHADPPVGRKHGPCAVYPLPFVREGGLPIQLGRRQPLRLPMPKIGYVLA